MKKRYMFFGLLSLFPLSWFTFGKYLNFDTLSAIIFVIAIGYLILKYRKKLDFQIGSKIFSIPIFYVVLWRTKFALKFMDSLAKKHRELVKLFGYCFIGLGFVGMIYISGTMFVLLYQLFTTPQQASQGVSLVLPLTHIPGVGFLSFWHFLIAIFVTMLIHECAHGIVARAHDVKVKSSGLGVLGLIFPLFPVAFVEPDEKQLSKKSDIIEYSVFAAGPLINVIFFFLVFFIFAQGILPPIENAITYPVGFSIQDVMANYSAQEVGMTGGMIITSVNGVSVLDYQAFSKELGVLSPGDQVNLGIENGTTFDITARASPDDPSTGYIGILGLRNERRINAGIEGWGLAFFWFKDMIKWLYLINLFVGLFNLLPLLWMTDGSRMLKVALEKIFPDKKKAVSIWNGVNLLFTFTILFALFLRYFIFGGFGFLG